MFVHDDWRVGEKLTLNLGVRYDLEMGMTEAENRNMRGFDFTHRIRFRRRPRRSCAAPAGVPLTPRSSRSSAEYQLWTNRIDASGMRTATISSRDSVHLRCHADHDRPRRRGLFISPFQINSCPGLGNPVDQQVRPSDTD